MYQIPHNRAEPNAGRLVRLFQTVWVKDGHLPVDDRNKLTPTTRVGSSKQDVARLHIHMTKMNVPIK